MTETTRRRRRSLCGFRSIPLTNSLPSTQASASYMMGSAPRIPAMATKRAVTKEKTPVKRPAARSSLMSDG